MVDRTCPARIRAGCARECQHCADAELEARCGRRKDARPAEAAAAGALPDPDEDWAAYLHNDWLESRITLGWIGFALLLALLAGALAHWFLGRGVPLPGLLAALVWLAMAGCLVHARFDFPFRVHSIATVFLLYCSILSCSSRAQK